MNTQLTRYQWYRRFLKHVTLVYGTGRQDYPGQDIVATYYPETTPEDAGDDDARRWGLEPV